MSTPKVKYTKLKKIRANAKADAENATPYAPEVASSASGVSSWIVAVSIVLSLVAIAAAAAGITMGTLGFIDARKNNTVINDIINNITNDIYFNTTNNYTIFECCNATNSTGSGVNVTAGLGINITYPSELEAVITNDGIRNITAGANANIDYTDPHEPVISCTGGTSNTTTQGLFTIVDVDITAADLAGGATKVIWTPPDSSVYLVLQSVIVVDQSVDFDVGGDYDIVIQFASVDGELSQVIAANDLPILSSFTPNLCSYYAGFNVNTINQPSNVIRAAYSSGGTTDYTSGSIHLRYWLLDTNAMSIGGSDNIVYVKDVSITAAGLASGGQVTILDNTDPAGQYEVIVAYTSASATAFSGGGGDQSIRITDGTSVYLNMNDPSSSTVAFSIQPSSEIFALTTTDSISTPTAAGADIYATYTGGTTDWTDGELILSMVLRKIAGNNAVGVQSIVEGPGITVDATDPQHPIVSVNPIGSIVYVTDVAITAAALASGGQVTIKAGAGTEQYRVITAYHTAGGSTDDFSGGGGYRFVQITDGTNVYGLFDPFTLDHIGMTSMTYGAGTDFIQLPNNGVSIVTPTVAGADIYAEYIGGTADYINGQMSLSMILQRYA
jgi:hypothetical protein